MTNGYHCCSECCSAYCHSCTSNCNSKGVCTESCTTYCCAHMCCSSTNNLKCTLICPIYGTVVLGVTFEANGDEINSSISTDFADDLSSAQSFYDKYSVGTEFVCHYNPENPYEVIIDPTYTTWKWVLTSFAIAGVLVFLIAVAVLCCIEIYKYTNGCQLIRSKFNDIEMLASKEPS